MTASQLYPLPTTEEIRVTPRGAHLQVKREQVQRLSAEELTELVEMVDEKLEVYIDHASRKAGSAVPG